MKNIPRDAPIGSVVIPKIGTGTSAYHVSCPGDRNADRDATVTFRATSTPVPGFTDVYPTSIPGLGIKYYFARNSGTGCGIRHDQTIPNSAFHITCHIRRGTTLSWSWGTSVELIKTGEISPGTLTSVPRVNMSYSLNNQSGSWGMTAMYSGNASGSVALPTCRTSDVAVPMGTHTLASLPNVGDVSPSVAFDININNCPSGLNQIRYRVDAVTPRVLQNSVVALNASSSATGIGVQLLNARNTPIELGSQHVLTTYSARTGGSYRIPLRARYYRTLQNARPGTANTSMLFTISYM